MDYIIREIKKAEYDLLNDFLYEAIYIPDGVEPPPKSIINCPESVSYTHLDVYKRQVATCGKLIGTTSGCP